MLDTVVCLSLLSSGLSWGRPQVYMSCLHENWVQGALNCLSHDAVPDAELCSEVLISLLPHQQHCTDNS